MVTCCCKNQIVPSEVLLFFLYIHKLDGLRHMKCPLQKWITPAAKEPPCGPRPLIFSELLQHLWKIAVGNHFLGTYGSRRVPLKQLHTNHWCNCFESHYKITKINTKSVLVQFFLEYVLEKFEYQCRCDKPLSRNKTTQNMKTCIRKLGNTLLLECRLQSSR